jgi:O-antigen/teichoic acid export membrane protein
MTPPTGKGGLIDRIASATGKTRWVQQFREPTSFLGHVVMLAGWTAISQALYVIALPILSRMYSVEAFGNLAVLQSVTAFTVVVAALRYEVAVLLPGDDETAMSLLGLSFVIIAATTAAIVLVVLVASPGVLFRGQLGFLRDLWWLIPITHLGSGAREALTHWAMRRKAFAAIARTKVSQVGAQLAAQLAMGGVGLGPMGLFLGDVLGRVAGAGTLVRLLWANDRRLLAGVSTAKMVHAARRYAEFPRYGIWAQMLSRSGRDFIPIALASLYGSTVAGWFGLASRVLAAPLELVCRSVSQVYLGEAADLARRDPVALKRLYRTSAWKLLLLGTAPSVVLALFGPQLFGFVFGSVWHGAGTYARYMALMLLAQFVNFPLAHTLTILEKQSWQLLWDAGALVAGLGGIVVLQRWGATGLQAVLYYSFAMAAMFGIHYLLTAIAIDRRVAAHRSAGAVHRES